jgi:hypothetical protein
MSELGEMVADLREHLAVANELFAVVEAEGRALRQDAAGSAFPFYEEKKNLLERFNGSVAKLKRHRTEWQRLDAARRAEQPEVTALLRQNQDLTMKIIVMDRENEQALLRRGLVPPREIPSANRQRPHFVADLYRRQGQS